MKIGTQQLDGWKEIAGYLKRSVRCVQRWERNEELPVRRHRHARGVSVYAFREELNAWWEDERSRSNDFNIERTISLGKDERAVTGRCFEHGPAQVHFVPTFEALLAAGAKIRGSWLKWLENAVKSRLSEEKARLAEILRRYGATA